jgi:hypothetical protein
VHDLAAAALAAVQREAALPAAPPHARVFNVGGPARLNRVQMALAVAEVGGGGGGRGRGGCSDGGGV